MALGSTQPLTEMSTMNFSGGKWCPARRADKLTAICEPIIWKMWEPLPLTNLWAFTACYRNSLITGRAIAQAVSRWLPTAAARVQTRVYSSGICGGQIGAWAGFRRVLWFPLQIFIPPISSQSPSPIIRGWYNSPVVAAVPRGLISPH
jgi:hypothetical protein